MTAPDLEAQALETIGRIVWVHCAEYMSPDRAIALWEAIAALSQRPAEDEWQPIETAPKDGTEIVAWCVHVNAQYADSQASRSEWEAPVIARWIDHNGGGWTWHGLCGRLTRWRHLPAPPSSAREEG